MPPDNTAHIFQKGYSKGTRAGHDSSQNGDTSKTGAVLPTHQLDARPDAIGCPVVPGVVSNQGKARGQGGENIACSYQRDHS